MGVASALFQACAASDGSPGSTRSTSGSGGSTGSGATTGTGGGTTTGGGASTGTGGTVGPINPGNPEAGADIKVTADSSCAATSTKGEIKQTDLLFMMDSSGSMVGPPDPGQTQTRWQALQTAIPPFLADMANAGMMVGLDFFPEGGLNASCNIMDYTNLDVPIAIIPGANNTQANAITMAINNRMPNGGTPTAPALSGAIQSARTFQMANPDRAISVLLLTDGQPTGCGVNMANPLGPAIMAAQAGTMGTPPILTYVLGVGPDTGSLDSIAAAGGTKMAYMATSGGASALSAALAAIRKSTLGCDYVIPKPEAGALDPGKVTVSVKLGDAGSQELPNVVNAAGCAGNPNNPNGLGWYYDNPTMPTKITLCPNSCGPLQVTIGSEVDILLGCAPKVIPPPN
jgi:Mg-chelatase subunit ChlD